MNKYLIIDKVQRVEMAGPYPQAVMRIMEELDKKGEKYDFFYNEEVALKFINNEFTITVGGNDLRDYTHVMLRGHHNRRDYEVKQIIVEYIDNYNKLNPDKPIMVQNSETYKVLKHYTKIFQAKICAENGIPWLDTYYRSDGKYKENNSEISEFPKIMKHFEGENDLRMIDGKWKIKKNVYKVENTGDFDQEYLVEKDPSEFFLQEFIPSGEDIRLYMQNDKVIGGWKRKATDNFITVSKGEYTFYNEPSQDIVELGQKVARVFKSNFIAIDIMYKGNVPYILEVNMNPGFKAYETKIEGGTPANIAKAIIESF